MVWKKMGIGLEALNKAAMDVGRSKSRVRRKTLNDDDEDDDAVTPRCWYKFRFFGSCLSTRTKVDSSVSGSGSSSQYGSLPLPWFIRMKIAVNAAKGLAYLHEEAEKPVIYRDFKTSNILLDVDYNAKLSGFALAKDGPEGDKTHVSTRVMGTYGYAAPENVMTGHLTAKSDAYSFGVVLLELLTGRRSMDKTRPQGEHNLVEWARPYLGEKRRFYRLIDPRLEGRSRSKARRSLCS